MKNKTIFQTIIRLADMMIKFLGEHAEIAIHDLGKNEKSLIHIAGNVTGRVPGAPPTDLLLMQLAEHGNNAPDLLPYATRSPNHKPLKTALVYIRNGKGEIIGAVCINVDISAHLEMFHVLESQLAMAGTNGHEENDKETFASTVEETGFALVSKVVKNMGKDPGNLTREERIQFVHMCDEMGVFKLKGVVEQVAKIMGISKYTLYSYKKLSGDNPP